MQKWEYLIVYLHRDTRIHGIRLQATDWEPKISLAALGEEGWELVAVTPTADIPGEINAGFTSSLEYIFKRPKQE